MFIDTHCHIHDDAYDLDIQAVLKRMHEKSVDKAICIGTDIPTSRLAIRAANQNQELYASVGVHPHEAVNGFNIEPLVLEPKVVAVGEIGLDYYYEHSPRQTQIEALEYQIKLALKANLPIIFHVREAYEDFWPIFDSLIGEKKDFKGVLHSYTDNMVNLNKGLERGLYVSVNGISTFTKDEAQKEVFKSIPLNRLLLETDAPFLTPAPFRGNINEPAYIPVIAQFHADSRGVGLEEIAWATTENARKLFSI